MRRSTASAVIKVTQGGGIAHGEVSIKEQLPVAGTTSTKKGKSLAKVLAAARKTDRAIRRSDAVDDGSR